MSTFENKVEALTDFLLNRASLRRLTTYDEVARVTANLLYVRGQRHHSSPIDRDKIAEVLKQIDTNSLEDKGILLSALVVHFADNKPGHRFFQQAVERGLLSEDATDSERGAFAATNLLKAFDSQTEPYPLSFEEVTPDDASDFDEDYEDEDLDEDASVGS